MCIGAFAVGVAVVQPVQQSNADKQGVLQPKIDTASFEFESSANDSSTPIDQNAANADSGVLVSQNASLSPINSNTVENWLALTSNNVKILHRSSSLKSTHTQVGPKKAVRFADALGLDLVETKLFFDPEFTEVPPWCRYTCTNGASKMLVPRFDLSVRRIRQYHLEEVRREKVSLESVRVNGLALTGSVRVANLAFEKKVTIRYTTDRWVNCKAVESTFIAQASDSQTDVFDFTLLVPIDAPTNGNVEFCIRYDVAGAVYWDNNTGRNYTCLIQSDYFDLSDDEY